jgi:hypothetical protein
MTSLVESVFTVYDSNKSLNDLKMVQRNGNQNAQPAEDSTSQGLARRRRAKILGF